MPNLEAVPALPHRPDVWSASNVQCSVRYEIQIEAEADSLCRVLNLFAMQYLIPQQVNVMHQDEMLSIDVQLSGLTWHRAQVIGQKMRSLINVCSVELEQLPTAHNAHPAVALAAG